MSEWNLLKFRVSLRGDVSFRACISRTGTHFDSPSLALPSLEMEETEALDFLTNWAAFEFPQQKKMDEVSYKCEAFARSEEIPRLRVSFIHKVSRDIQPDFFAVSYQGCCRSFTSIIARNKCWKSSVMDVHSSPGEHALTPSPTPIWFCFLLIINFSLPPNACHWFLPRRRRPAAS